MPNGVPKSVNQNSQTTFPKEADAFFPEVSDGEIETLRERASEELDFDAGGWEHVDGIKFE